MTTRIVFVLGLLVLFILAVLGILAVQHRAPHTVAERYMLDNTGEVRAVIDYRNGGLAWSKSPPPPTFEEAPNAGR